MMRMTSLVCGAVAAALMAPTTAWAQAIQFRDFSITFDTIWRSVSSTDTRPDEPSRFPWTFTAIAGAMVSWAGGECMKGQHSFVYKPGTVTESVSCPVERKGNSLTYHEYGSAGTFQTTTAIAGNVVTLRGRFTGRGPYTFSYCGEKKISEKTFDVTETLKVRIAGRSCQVLEYSRTAVETQRQTHRDDGNPLETKTTTSTIRLAPRAKCTFKVTSEQPVLPPGPGLVSVEGRCG